MLLVTIDNYKEWDLFAGNSKTKGSQIIKLTAATANGVFKEETQIRTHGGCICINCHKDHFPLLISSQY